MLNFTEIFKLKEMLEKAKIPFVFRELKDFGGYQILYPEIGENNICDVILYEGSYGGEQGLLEIMGLVDEEIIGDAVEGHLTAEECFGRIKKHYEENGK